MRANENEDFIYRLFFSWVLNLRSLLSPKYSNSAIYETGIIHEPDKKSIVRGQEFFFLIYLQIFENLKSSQKFSERISKEEDIILESL